MRLHVFQTGKVEVPTKVVYRDGSVLEKQTVDVLVFAIEHPRQGIILFGTGLNRALADDSGLHLQGWLIVLGKPTMAQGQEITAQLPKAKLSQEKVRHVILPDLRFDHTGEVESFPTAQVIVAASEHLAATGSDADRLSLGEEYDQVRTWQFVNFTDATPLGTFLTHRDLFEDGSILILDATGATAGGLAVLVRLPSGPVLLCGNLAWTKEQYFHVRFPGLVFDRKAWWEKVWRLKKFKELVPELVVLPDHEWATVEAAKTKDMILHPFVSDEKKDVGKTDKEKKTAKKKLPVATD
jgi:N-acyl homoserine lactone hydrolase